MIKEVSFPELGFFSRREIEGIAKKLNRKSYMNFVVKSGNCAGNHTLVVQVEDMDESPEEIKNFILFVALSELAG